MTVSITLSKTLNGANVSDALTGGDNGYNWGSSENGDNDPAQQQYYLRHDGSFFIFNLALYVRPYSGTYGGDYSANADYTRLKGHGDSGFGIQCDLTWNASPPFTVGLYTVFNSSVGMTFPQRITVPTNSLFYYNAGTPIAASSPVAGKIGASGDSALGDMALMRFRDMVPSGEAQSGKRQFDIVYAYNYTS